MDHPSVSCAEAKTFSVPRRKLGGTLFSWLLLVHHPACGRWLYRLFEGVQNPWLDYDILNSSGCLMLSGRTLFQIPSIYRDSLFPLVYTYELCVAMGKTNPNGNQGILLSSQFSYFGYWCNSPGNYAASATNGSDSTTQNILVLSPTTSFRDWFTWPFSSS